MGSRFWLAFTAGVLLMFFCGYQFGRGAWGWVVLDIVFGLANLAIAVKVAKT